jgi:hypothetical protein
MIGFLSILAVLLGAQPASAQGSLPIALQQVSDQNGKPIVGALLYFYQVGTVATRQDSFQDTALVNPNQWPLPSDAYGRIPMFYVASGSIHVRLTDPGGLVIFDYPNMLVIGPSGGGGGGGAIDPTTIASTGDMKFRPSSEVLTGWVRMNGNTIGNSVSGATERANADTQALFIYLWGLGLTPSGGRGASGLADFNASKTIATIDMRGMAPVGLDTMGAAAAGRLNGALFTAGNSSTPLSTGGEASHVLTTAELPPTTLSFSGNPISITPTFFGNSVTPTFSGNFVSITPTFSGVARNWNLTTDSGLPAIVQGAPGSTFSIQIPGSILAHPTANQFTTVTPDGTISAVSFTPSGSISAVTPTGSISAVNFTPSGSISGFGSGTAGNRMAPFILGSFYLKL